MSQLIWRKSSFSGGGNGDCVETAAGPGELIYVRESDHPDEIVATTVAKWDAFLKSIKAGRFGAVSLS